MTLTIDDEMRPSDRPAGAGRLGVLALLAITAASALGGGADVRHEATPVEFLPALGEPAAVGPPSRPHSLSGIVPAVPPEARLAVELAASKRVVLGRPTTMGLRLTVTKPARASASLRDSKQRRLHSWSLRVDAGATVFELRLPARVREPGTYSLAWVVRSGSETVRRTITVTLVTPAAARARSSRDREVVLVGRTPANDALEPGVAGVPRRITRTADVDEAFTAIASSPGDVRVAVVDADAFGTHFVTDLRTVFSSLRVIAISREPATRAQALRAGAVLALPRDVSARRLRKAVAALAAA